jgi:FlaA1/EpsC-like NDP-sugar epimerase
MKVYNGQADEDDLKSPLIPEINAMPVIEMARIVADCLGIDDFIVEEVGLRPGEKIHECLYSSHEYCITSENATQCDKEEIKQYVKDILDV